MTTTSNWTVRALRSDEGAALHRLSVACFGEGAHTAAFVDHRFCNGSAVPAEVVVAECDGRLIGAQAVTYLNFFAAGKEVTAGMFTDGMTHPNYRRQGVFRALLEETERRAFANEASLLFTMPNDRSLPSFQRSPGWHILPDRVLLARVVEVAGLLEDRGAPKPLARGVGALTHWAIRNGSHLDTNGLDEVNDLAPYAAEIDTLTEGTLPRLGGVACSRKHAFLDWRFAKNPSWRYRYFVAKDSTGRLSGYLVTVVEQRMGTSVCYAADMLWTDERDMIRLLDFAALAVKSGGARLFGSIVSSPALIRVLRMAGFRQVPASVSKRSFHTAYAVHPDRSDIAAIAREGDAWFLSLADFDTI
ncbi:MAG: GNAT family N-acetyltransferase [Bryobacterales bacterium]